MTDLNRIRADIESSAAIQNVNLKDPVSPWTVWQHNGQTNYFPALPASFKTITQAVARADVMPGQAIVFGVDPESGKAMMRIRLHGQNVDDGEYSW